VGPSFAGPPVLATHSAPSYIFEKLNYVKFDEIFGKILTCKLKNQLLDTSNICLYNIWVSLSFGRLRLNLCLSRITSACFNAGLNKLQTTTNINLQIEIKFNVEARD
jgi:hypothetical protein